MRVRHIASPATLVLALAGAATPAAAQDSTSATPRSPYSSLAVTLGGVRTLSTGKLDRYWSTGTGGHLAVHTPFYVGEAGAFVTVIPHHARADAQPDYRAYVIGIDWRMTAFPASRFRPSASVSVGDYLSAFDGVETKGLAKESEIFFGGTVGLAGTILGGTSVVASVTGLQVLTSTPIRTTYVTVGLARTLGIPAWLRGIMQ